MEVNNNDNVVVDGKTRPHYKVVKNKLDNVLRDVNDTNIIRKVVVATNRIVIHTLMFLKIHMLYCCKHELELPLVTKELILYCMRVVREVKIDGRTKEQETYNKLTAFYTTYYRNTVFDHEAMTSVNNLTQILDYAATDIKTDYETNIKQHFVEYIERFVNVVFDKKEKMKSMTEEQQREFVCRLRSYKTVILERKGSHLLPSELTEHLPFIMPIQKSTHKGKHISYELQANPQAFLRCMIYMMRFVESKGQKCMNIFPCRTDLVPKYIRFDTSSLIRLLLKDEHRNGRTQTDFLNHIEQEQARLWNLYFRTDSRCFRGRNKGKYKFHYMIETDGVACSVLLVWNEPIAKEDKINKKEDMPKELYFDDIVNDKKLDELRAKRMVAIDPGKSDLIYCTSGNGKEAVHFRYTQNQRNKESKKNVHKKRILKEKKHTVGDENNVIRLETELSNFNHKTVDFDKYLEYVTKKNEVNSKLFSFYEQEHFRKMKWNAHINRNRSEDMMINNFKKKFGGPDEVVIAFGDWEQKHQMKFKEPTKGKGFRKLFCEKGYEVYLVDEHRTSCMCYDCGSRGVEGSCEKFKYVDNKNPRSMYKEGMKTILCHGLLRCKTCSRMWNRDVNGSLNIGMAGKNALEKMRPRYLSRSHKNASLQEDGNPTPNKKRKLSVLVKASTPH
jgi:hypothetical protein